MHMIELEKTYLAKELPKELENCRYKEIIDIYIPKQSDHPKIRIRKNGDKYEMTKKEPIDDEDSSEMLEETINLTEIEFNALLEIDGKKVHKKRYYYTHLENTIEIDIFQGALLGLVLVDVEFESVEEKNSFEMPSFCLADITQELFTAGGIICGKTYSDIEKDLERFNYSKLYLNQ